VKHHTHGSRKGCQKPTDSACQSAHDLSSNYSGNTEAEMKALSIKQQPWVHAGPAESHAIPNLHKPGFMFEYNVRFDPSAEIDRYFDDSSLATTEPPHVVIIAGGVAAGKTSLRRARYSTGYVVLDAAEIFQNLCQGKSLGFPGPFEEPMIMIGHGVAQRIYRERRNFVTEIIGRETAPVRQLFETVKAAGYQIEFAGVTCDATAAVERNAHREESNISSYYTEHYHRQWILETMTPDAKVPDRIANATADCH